VGAVQKSNGSGAAGRAMLAPRWGGSGGGGGRSWPTSVFFNPSSPHKMKYRASLRFCSNAAAAPAPTAMNRINAFMIRTPLFTGVAVATIKTALADVLMQLTTGKSIFSEEYDWNRTGLFVLFGFGYMGIANYIFYYKGFTKLFPYLTEMTKQPFSIKMRDPRFLKQLFAANIVDNAIINPIIYWPVFYSFKEICFADDSDTRTVSEMISDVAERYKGTWMNDNMSMAYFWVPANLLIYAVPIHLRLPLNHAISAAWSFILSYAWGAKTTESEAVSIALSGDVGAGAGDLNSATN